MLVARREKKNKKSQYKRPIKLYKADEFHYQVNQRHCVLPAM